MNSSNYMLLNRVFSRNIFKNLIEGKSEETYISAIRRYINDPEGKNNLQLISEIYQTLNEEYRNEYYYKNTLLNKLLMGVHSPRTTTALTEVPVFKSKADFILINGKAVVYEIKTELDNFDRLDTQIEDYYKAFNHVVVVTSESNFIAIEKKLSNSKVGIYTLNSRNCISKKKNPIKNNEYLDLKVIFKVLRKNEYETILMIHYGYLPQVSQFNYYKTCLQMFCNIDKDLAYKLFLQELKKRNRIDTDLFIKIPYELKSLFYFSDFKKEDYYNLNNFLKQNWGGENVFSISKGEAV